MIRVLFSPQVNETDKLAYAFVGETVAVTYNDDIDTFDFSGLPEGTLENAETHLPVNVFQKAYRKDGILHLELLNFIGRNATEEERFPKWKDV